MPSTPESPGSTRPSKPVRRGRQWAWWPLRVTAVIQAILIFDQAVFAGQFLSGNFAALHTHRENATYSGIATIVMVVAAIVLRWPGRGPVWPVFLCVAVFGLIALQIVLGFSGVKTVHVPLGVAIITISVLVLAWVWLPKQAEPRQAPAAVPTGAASAAVPAEIPAPSVRIEAEPSTVEGRS